MINAENRMRILISAYACEPNKGSEPGVGWNWAIHLAEKFEVYVITRENNKAVIEDFLKNKSVSHLHFIYYDCTGFIRKIKKYPNGIYLYYKKWQKEILPLARKVVKENDIDIVHHITFNAYRTPGKLYQLNKPFVWGPIGGGQFYNPVLKAAYFTSWNIIKEQIRNLMNYGYLWFSKDIHKVLKQAACILIADQSTEKIMPKSREYIKLLETAYDISCSRIKKYKQAPADKIRLLWVGGIWPRKGLKLLIDALGESDFRNFDLEIIGEGEDRKANERLVSLYKLEQNIHFIGALTYQRVNEEYAKADIFIFTSLRDTSGNVVLEAMSHGLPVVALNHHGVGEIVTEETGTLIDVQSYDQIKRDILYAIVSYYKDYNKIEVQGKAARCRIESKYSWKRNIQSVSEIYEQIKLDNK